MITPENVTVIYVSQANGSDKETGFYPVSDDKKNGPVKTLERAFEYIRQLRFFGHKQPICVKITDEEYFLEKPVVIDGAYKEIMIPELPDGIFNVTVEPYTKTLISGGIRITGFKEDSFNGVKCFSADVPQVKEGLWFTDFYVNGKRADFTRFPKSGVLKPLSVDDNGTALQTHSKWFIAKHEDLEKIKSFKNFGDCFISYNHYWIDEHTPIESYDTSTGKIVCKYLSRFSVSSLYPASALEYIIENVAESFANPNEWYLDRESARVYYIPESPNQKAEDIVAYAPVCDKLFEIRGNEATTVKNVTIRGFELAYTKGDYSSIDSGVNGEPEIDENGNVISYASDAQSVCNAHGSIELSFAEFCSIENCRLYCLGVHAIKLKNGCRHNRIDSNDIYDTGAGGISSSGEAHGCAASLVNGFNTFSNNIIKHIGRRYYSACGILVKHSEGNLISHNDISDLFYTGISVGWVWGYSESITKNNIIEYNHIYNIGQGKLSDMGGIYLLGKQSGTVVKNNVIHDVTSAHYGGWGIYTDEGSSYITVENNVCYNLSCNGYHQHFGCMNTVRNNIFAKSKEWTVKISKTEMRTGIIFEGNILVSEGTAIYKIGYDDTDSSNIHNISSHNNLMYDYKSKDLKLFAIGDDGYSPDEAKRVFGFEDGGIIADPCFTDYENNDLTLQDNSPAFSIGFKPIDIKKAGVIR